MKLPVFARVSLTLAAAGLLASCGLVGGPPTATPFATTAAPTEPAALATPTAEATPTAPPTPPTEPTRRPPPATDAPLPRGILTADDFPIEGWLGSYCWHGTCADVPAAAPKEQLPLLSPLLWGESDELEFSLSDGATFHTWRAAYAADSDGTQTTLGEGGQGFDPDANPSAEPELLSSVTFEGLPRGDWVVFVQVFFEGGDLSYAWHSSVPRLPPTGEVRFGEGSEVQGYTGSWCYDGGCADSPSVPFIPELRVRRGSELTFAFDTGDQFAFARAQYRVERGDPPSLDLGSVGTYVDPDTNATPGPLITEFTFDAPPRGDWLLDINVRFPGDLGDAPYHWHAIVE